ncbi:MAG: nucleotide sugar dehydrogenase [Euryarchaeota archaeon]|jgi:nucleotide sugar dehydrogenase|nr:nucleotide sugar dehydrogenase [Euryarchaeota archaeon]
MGWDNTFSKRLAARDLTVGVIGLGYVGLPTALGFLDAGFSVRGVDVTQRVISALEAGQNPGDDPQHDDIIPSSQSDSWKVSTNSADLVPDCDVILVTVPTPVTEERLPDLKYVASAGAAVFDAVAKNSGTIVVLESTVYPGVTREIWSPLLEAAGLVEGEDVHLAYCPERFVPGDEEHGVRQVARVVGAPNKEVGEGLRDLYDTLTTGGVTYVGALEVAEAAKVVENVQRDLNIALVNELARIFPVLGIDVEEVLDAAATKWNFHRYRPGVGVGGHCIPVDPYYLIEKARAAGAPVELITSARAVNRAMPENVAKDMATILNGHELSISDSNILLLGWSYKAGIGDPRETPAEPLAVALGAMGATVQTFDPLVDDRLFPTDLATLVRAEDDISPFDIAILVTAHDEVIGMDWAKLSEKSNQPIIYDGRRVLNVEMLESLGWCVYLLGAPL